MAYSGAMACSEAEQSRGGIFGLWGSKHKGGGLLQPLWRAIAAIHVGIVAQVCDLGTLKVQ